MKINVRDAPKLQAALDAAQNGARTRTLDADAVREWTDEAENKLARAGVPVDRRPGTQLTVDPFRVPNSYKYGAQTTAVLATRGSTGWFVTEVARCRARSCSGGADLDPDDARPRFPLPYGCGAEHAPDHDSCRRCDQVKPAMRPAARLLESLLRKHGVIGAWPAEGPPSR